jgi:hypothetical protein
MDLTTIPHGRVRRQLTETFLPTKTAGWLELGPGCSGGSLGAAGYHYYEIGHSAGGTCTLRTAFDISIHNYEQVALHVDGFHVSDDSLNPGLGIKDVGSTRGVSIWTPAGASTATYRAFGSGAPDVQVPYGWGGTEATRRRNLGLMIRPKTREVQLVADDQVIWSHVEPNLQLGAVRFVVDSTQAGITNGKLRMAQVRVELQHN